MKRFPRLNLKNINRLFMLAVVFAPIFYLFGSLFSAISGDKQEFPLSASYDVSTSSRIVDFNQYVNLPERTYRNVTTNGQSVTCPVSSDNSGYTQLIQSFDEPIPKGHICLASLYKFSGTFTGTLAIGGYSLSSSANSWQGSITLTNDNGRFSNRRVVTDDVDGVYLFFYGGYEVTSSLSFVFNYFDLTRMYGAGNEPTADVFFASYPEISYSYVYSEIQSLHTYGVPDNSQYLFNQFFAKDNFLVQMGKDSLSADPNGFAPANSLVQLLDESIFHYGSENQIACMAYGYAVWVFNAVVLDMVIVLSLKLLLLPLRAVEIFEKGEKE